MAKPTEPVPETESVVAHQLLRLADTADPELRAHLITLARLAHEEAQHSWPGYAKAIELIPAKIRNRAIGAIIAAVLAFFGVEYTAPTDDAPAECPACPACVDPTVGDTP